MTCWVSDRSPARCSAPPNDRKVKSVRPLVAKINALEPEFRALTDVGHQRAHGGAEGPRGERREPDALLPEAFANCREAARAARLACAPST